MRYLYQLLAYLLLPAYAGAMLWRGLRERGYWHGFAERFGFGPAVGTGASIWVHAVSVGEVQAAAALVQALRQRCPDTPLVVTTVTPAGAERARALCGPGVLVRYLPFDLPGAVRRFLGAVRPRLAIVVEADLWPTLLHALRRRDIPLVLASARISARSAARYARFGGLLRDALAAGVEVAAQTAADAARFEALGVAAQRTRVVGNIKFDFTVPSDIGERAARIRGEQAPLRPAWTAGSTHAGEEEILIAAHRQLRERVPQALLVLAPRHPPRFVLVAEMLRRSGVRFAQRSRGATAAPDTEVLLLDTLGELLAFYAAADVAFVGGSLVPVGGHNLLEPAALARPILTGPSNSNAPEIAQRLIDCGAARVVSDAAALAGAVAALLADPAERARIGALGLENVERNRGALGRVLAILEPLL